jgi:PTH2 family peptidyl-tRNA hydrolase|tara:strand:- start:7582 stop:7950 length:369 start_codon:yes stop_codon:yes gene_type:complete
VGKNSFGYKMCIVLRMDLGMSTGKLIAQAAHAAVGASDLGKKENHKAWRNWRDKGAKKVSLEAESLKELKELQSKAVDLDIVNIIIQDAGHTEVPTGTITALGLGPDKSDLLDKVTGSLPLI